MNIAFTLEPKQAATLGAWVNTDENISPACIQVEVVAHHVHVGGEKVTKVFARVTQGDDGVYIDGDGKKWDWDDFGLELVPFKEE